jgi:hypothetical protein
LPRRAEIQLIVGDQNFIRIDAIKRCHCRHGFTAQVHKGGGHQQANIRASKVDT